MQELKLHVPDFLDHLRALTDSGHVADGAKLAGVARNQAYMYERHGIPLRKFSEWREHGLSIGWLDDGWLDALASDWTVQKEDDGYRVGPARLVDSDMSDGEKRANAEFIAKLVDTLR